MKDFNDKIAVITGGASGVGRSIAFALGRRGAKILIADVDKSAMETTTKELQAENITASSQFCDVTSLDDCNALVKTAVDTYGRIDLAFANAGIAAGESGAMWEYSDKDWNWCFNVNMWGAVNSIRAFMPQLMKQDGESHITITGSGNGALLVYPDTPIYTASKAAVHAITENLHFQTEFTPINVHALFPGPHVVDTGLFNSSRVRPDEFKKPGGDDNETGISSVDDMIKMCEQFGIDLQVTHPDEVAAMAVKGIEDNQFWMLATTPETDAKLQERLDMINNRTNPVRPMIGA